MKRVETGKHKKGVVSGIIEKTRRPVYSYKHYTELWSEMWHNKDCKESGKNRSAYYWWLTCKNNGGVMSVSDEDKIIVRCFWAQSLYGIEIFYLR